MQLAGGGFGTGFTFSRNFQVGAEFRAATIHWSLKDGADDSPTQYLSGAMETAAFHLKYSDRTSEIASPKGKMFGLAAGYVLHTGATPSAPFARVSARQTVTLAGKNLLSFSGEVNTFFRRDVPDPLRFTLGGPTRLYASSTDEYRGTDTALSRALYLRRIATLPTGLGQGIYLTGGYEAGEVWSPERRSFLRQDGVAGLLLNTPVGALTVGGAVGDAGRRKVFFTFGKLF